MNDKLKGGILAALVTPFDGSGKIDKPAIRALVKKLLAEGIGGFFVCGSTGEAFLMDGAERRDVFETVAEANGGKGSLICHCGAIGTDLGIALAKHAAELGADAVSSVPPFYHHFSNDEILAYFNDLADASGKPVIVYNIPSFCGVTITPAMMASLRNRVSGSLPGVVGIKFTSLDLFAMEQMKTNDPDLLVYNGFDEVALAGFSMGADGAIGSNFNIMGKYFIDMQRLFLQNKVPEAQVLQRKANAAIAALYGTGKLISCIKYIIGLQGIPYGNSRRPFSPLTEDDKKVCQQVFEGLRKDGIE
ncbi:N-acetylneuraminate lyase [Spirochaetia bacterium]|nr:N-acetylneuraminate lyase [Spirochaetia bacterium]